MQTTRLGRSCGTSHCGARKSAVPGSSATSNGSRIFSPTHRKEGELLGSRLAAQARDRSGFDSDAPEVSGDWRAFRAQLVADENHSTSDVSSRWAHELATPEKGCLLVARRFDLGGFNNSVILITEHADAVGTRGVILNHPLPMDMLKRNHPQGVPPQVPCYIGGPVEMRSVTMIHNRGILGASEIIKGVYCGGKTGELAGLDREEKWRNVKMFLGTSCWAPHQLSAELHDAPAWFVMAASEDVIFGRGFGLDPRDEGYAEKFWENVIQLSNVDFPQE